MQPIKPHLWFDHSAKEAAEFYAAALPDSAVNFVNHFSMPDGSECEVAEFTISGQSFFGISSGHGIGINPSISFVVHLDTPVEIDQVWEKLAPGGKTMMPLDKYPFSERYGWVADKFGISWQLMLNNPDGEKRPVIVPSLMFTDPVAGQAKEALDFYTSVFKDGNRGTTTPRPQDMGPDKAGSLMYADFFADNTWLAAMDSAHPHGFSFNDAVSLLIACDTQEEIDALWPALSAGGQPGQCGWLKDKYGVSWQVASTVMMEALKNGSREQIDRVTRAFMGMQKVDSAALQKAYNEAS